MNATAPIIEIRGVDKYYGSHHVLKQCSTRVDKGEIVAVSYTHLTLPTILLV